MDSSSSSSSFVISAFDYEFNKHFAGYSDIDVVSWDFNIYEGAFASSSNAYFKKSNAAASNGTLILSVTEVPVADRAALSAGRQYAGAGVTAWGLNPNPSSNHGTLHAQKYGRWEVEAKLPGGYGVIAYIGLFPNLTTWGGVSSWPPEIG